MAIVHTIRGTCNGYDYVVRLHDDNCPTDEATRVRRLREIEKLAQQLLQRHAEATQEAVSHTD